MVHIRRKSQGERPNNQRRARYNGGPLDTPLGYCSTGFTLYEPSPPTSRQSKNRREILVPQPVIEDLDLMLETLSVAKAGINMNLIIYRAPTHIHQSDACPAGLGGYSSNDRVWRFKIPSILQFWVTLNFLEFLGCQIGPLIDIEESNLPPLSCVLSITDSTTAAGWLKKSNFREELEGDMQLRLKRETAR